MNSTLTPLVLLHCSIRHFGPEQNVSILAVNIDDPLRRNLNDFGDLRPDNLEPPLGKISTCAQEIFKSKFILL